MRGNFGLFCSFCLAYMLDFILLQIWKANREKGSCLATGVLTSFRIFNLRILLIELIPEAVIYRSLYTMHSNASSMLSFSLALVSKKAMSYSSASFSPSSRMTARGCSISHLFPISSLMTSSLACSSIFLSHLAIFSNDRRRVMS